MPQTVPVPDYVSEAARRGLEWHAEGKSGDGVVDRTIREARDMVEGSISEDKVRRMGPWFRRHRADMDAPKNKPGNDDFPGAGAVAWALWGGPTSGDIMRTAEWAERTAARLDEEAALANLSKNKMTIEEQLAKIEAEAAAVLAERDDLRATVEKLTVGAASELEAVKAEAAAKDARIVELSGAIEASDKLVAELTEKVMMLEASKVSASAEAAKIAASVGVAPVEVSPADGVESVADNRSVLEKYLALSGDARTAFFNANKAAIMAAMRVS
jgi:hypothetical protein